MDSLKKLLIVLSVLFILSAIVILSSCEAVNDQTQAYVTNEVPASSGANTQSTTKLQSTASITTQTPATTAAITTVPVTTQAPITDVIISKDGVSDYIAIYHKGDDRVAANRLVKAFKRFLSASITFSADTRDESKHEIIVGNADRDGVKAGIAKNTYGYEVIDGKVYIYGSSETMVYYAVEHFINTYVKNAENGNLTLPIDLSYEGKLENYEGRDWLLYVPKFDGGKLYSSPYNAGAGLINDYMSKVTIEDSYMQCIENTTPKMFEAYLSKLESFGFEREFYNTIEENLYARYVFGDIAVYAYYLAGDSTTRIIEDRSSNAYMSEVERKAEVDNKKVELYQYSVDYSGGVTNPASSINCGMFYIIKLTDSSLILIDGGHTRQATEPAIAAMYEFLYEVSGKDKSEKLDIAAWYFTHPHGDHVTVCYKLLEYMKDQPAGIPNINAVIHNFPSESLIGQASETQHLRQTVNEYYPKMKFLKLFTGMNLEYSGLTLNVIYSNEAAFTPTGLKVNNENDACTVVRLELDSAKVMLLGDINSQGEGILLSMYSEKYLESDMVQAAHHGLNRIEHLYSTIKAPYVIVPQSNYNAVRNSGYEEFTKHAQSQNIFYGDKCTYRFIFYKGGVKITEYPRYDVKTEK